MRSIDISMFSMAALAGKRVPVARPQPAAFATALRGVSGINVINADARAFGPTDTCHSHQTEEPLTKLAVSTGTIAAFFADWFNVQVLEHQDGIRRSPATKLSCCFSTKRLAPVGLFTTQPLQETPHGVRVFSMCLMVDQLLLKALADFTGFLVGYFKRFTRNEQSISFGGGHHSVGSAEINPDRSVTDRIGNLDSKTKRHSTGAGDSNAVVTNSIVKVLSTIVRDSVFNLSTTSQSSDTKDAFLEHEFTIPATISMQEQGRCPFEHKRVFSRTPIGAGRCVGGYYRTDSGAFHLRVKRAFNRMIDRFVKLGGAEIVAFVICYWRYFFLKTIIFMHKGYKTWYRFGDYRNCTFNLHTINTPHKIRIVKMCWKDFMKNLNQPEDGVFPRRGKPDGSLRLKIMEVTDAP